MNRMCPSEEMLSEYLSGVLLEKDKAKIEEHLAQCTECRKVLAQAHDILKKPDIREIRNNIFRWFKGNKWLIGSALSLVLSFLFSRYFLQFLAASLLMGGKWIIDSKTTKMLIMIHEAWKSEDKDKVNKIFSRFDSKK